MLDRPAKMTDFILMEIIGQGGHGRVVKVKLRNKPQLLMAMKQIEKTKLEEEPGRKEQLVSEVEIMESLYHPNILEFYGYFEDSRHLNLLLEYSEDGCLFSNRDKAHYELSTTLILDFPCDRSTCQTCSRPPSICTTDCQLLSTETSNQRMFSSFLKVSS